MANLYVRSTDGSDADNGTTWALAKATLAGALAVAAAGDTIYVSQAHSETQASAMTLTLPGTAASPNRVLCANDAAEPPTALATTAKIATTGASTITVGGFGTFYGIEFEAGSAGNNASILLGVGGSSCGLDLDSCYLDLNTTHSNGLIALGPAANSGNSHARVDLTNCQAEFGATGQSIQFRHGNVHIAGLTLAGAGSTPTTLFTLAAATAGNTLVEASDLSFASSNITNLVNVSATCAHVMRLRNCKLDASITIVTGTHPGPGGTMVELIDCDSGDTNYRFARHDYLGSVVQETTIVRTGGASDGTTPIAWKMASSANTKLWWPLASPEIVLWNEATGSALTATVEIVNDGLTLQNDDVWIEVMHLGVSGVPQGVIDLDDRVADVLATPANQASSSVTWTTTGLASPVKQKLEATFTPQEKGPIVVRVYLADPSRTIYVCPKATVA